MGSKSAELSHDKRARDTETGWTDDERFALVIRLMGAVPSICVPPTSASLKTQETCARGHTPGTA
jgi:hypothetical protein